MSSADAAGRTRDLRPPHSLGFKLGILFALLLTLLAGAGYYGARLLLGADLERDIRRFEDESGRRAAAELDALARRVEGMAELLSRLAAATPGGAAALRPPVPALLQGRNLAALSAVGFWPEPNSIDVARDRASAYWVMGADGKLSVREGYNDPRAVPYYREPWYTPVRYAAPGRCYWTPAYTEPLVKREIVSCAMALRAADNRFAGVVTLSVGVAQLAEVLDRTTSGDSGYSLLTDADGHLLGVSGSAMPLIERGGKPRNFAELAQRLPAFSPVAVELHRAAEARRDAVAPAPAGAGAAMELKAATRDFAAADAERVLARLRAAAADEPPAPGATGVPLRVALSEDAVLGRAATALISPVAASGWHLIRVLPAGEGLSGARRLFGQTLLLAAALSGILLLATLLALSLTVFRPLRGIVQRVAAAATPEEALKLTLNQGPRNELGALAFWINERMRQFRELVDRAGASQLQLNIEAKERRGALEQLLRFQERSLPALQAVADALITTDEQGSIEDMNPAAERLTAVSLTAARGRPLTDLVSARSTTSDVTAAGLVQAALQRGTRVEPREDFLLRGSGGSARPVRLVALPVRSRGNRVAGVVLLLRESAVVPAAVPAQERRQPSTDFRASPSRREACEKRIRELAEARAGARRHALLLVDLDQLRHINESGGRAAGDEAISRLGALLGEKSGSLGEVFYLHADRYALLLPGFDAQRARSFADSLRESVAHLRAQAGARPVGLTASIGVAEFDAAQKPAEVLARAEDACATAKRAGRNTVRLYDNGMARAPRDVDDAAWVRRIRAGLDRRMLHVTTQYAAAAAGTASGGAAFESQLALEDEEGFWSEAAAFMPAAERHGLAAAVDRWHIGQIAAQLARPEQTAAPVLLRLSQSSIFDAELPDFLIELMERHKTLAGRLCLEISESSLLAYPQQSYSLAEVLRIVGIRLAIGDFLGRDPLALAQLRPLPAEILRIDARRYRGIGSDALEQKLADSTLQLARSLNRQSWVHGLDDSTSLDAWRRFGAAYTQGNAVARSSPVPFKLP